MRSEIYAYKQPFYFSPGRGQRRNRGETEKNINKRGVLRAEEGRQEHTQKAHTRKKKTPGIR